MSYVGEAGEFDYEPETPLSRQVDIICRHEPGRVIISDGYEDYVHADDYKYQCNPKDKNSTFAEPAI